MARYTDVLDARDAEIVAERVALYALRKGPRVGDWVVFADGTIRRISYRWTDGTGWDGGTQTSDLGGLCAGNYHLGKAGVSFSGGLHPHVPTDTLTDSGQLHDATAWIFHHDHSGAGRGVYFPAPFRVYTCSLEANR
jgi:hypothetical protein